MGPSGRPHPRVLNRNLLPTTLHPMELHPRPQALDPELQISVEGDFGINTPNYIT